MIIEREQRIIEAEKLVNYDHLYVFLVHENEIGNLAKTEIQPCYLQLQNGLPWYSSNEKGRIKYTLDKND